MVLPVDPECLRELARSVGEASFVSRGGTTIEHPVETGHGLERPYQDASGDPFSFGDDVEQPVYAVAQVHIGHARGSEQRVAPPRRLHEARRHVDDPPRMKRRIVLRIRFGLDNPTNEFLRPSAHALLADQELTDELGGDAQGTAVEEMSRNRLDALIAVSDHDAWTSSTAIAVPPPVP